MTSTFQRFFRRFVQGSYPLFAAAVVAIIWANVSQQTYHSVWHAELAFSIGPLHVSKSLVHWIDEALMAFFFFAVGLEIKREFLVGGLSSPQRALLPIMAAVGGMVVPAAIYAAINYHTPNTQGWGIPMATDIAFSLAVLALLKQRIPFGIKLFLTAFAIADDLGAVIVIAFFYTAAVNWNALLAGGLFLLALLAANRLWVRSSLVYLMLGVGLWVCILISGVHATVAGVLTAIFVPARAKYDTDTFVQKVQGLLEKFQCNDQSCGFSILRNRQHLESVQSIHIACQKAETPLQRLEHSLHPWIAYAVLPLFALANSGIFFQGFDLGNAVSHPITLGVFFGLSLGKPVGIAFFSIVAVDVLKTPLGVGITRRHILGVSFLGGIGFTMSLFITGLSFVDPEQIELAKFAIVAASIFSGIVGYIILHGADSPPPVIKTI